MNNSVFSSLSSDSIEIYKTAKTLFKNRCMFQYMDNHQFNGRKVKFDNQELLHFGNCSYLGLETHPKLIEYSINATRKYGTQTSCSRALLSCSLYEELESDLKKIFNGFPVVSPTTTLGHCSFFPTIIQSKDAIILDAYVHNSVRMASQLCRANGTFVTIAKHNDIEHIEYLIYRLKKEGYKNIWYCADGIYSIHGDLLDVKVLYDLLDKENNFYAYIDDAHGVSWTGKHGCGYVYGNFGLHQKVILAISFAKSFAACGGALIFPNEKLSEIVRMTGQTMLFSGPISPPVLGALVGSVKLHLSDDIANMQNELVELISYFRKKCKSFNFPLITNAETPIQLIRIGNIEQTFKVLNKLIEKKCLVTAAAYPAIAKGDEGIRITLTRFIKKEDIDFLLNNIKEILISIDNY